MGVEEKEEISEEKPRWKLTNKRTALYRPNEERDSRTLREKRCDERLRPLGVRVLEWK